MFYLHGAMDIGVWLEINFKLNHLEVAGSIPTTGKNNKEYLL